MIFKLLGDKDYKLNLKKGKFVLKRKVPAQSVVVTERGNVESIDSELGNDVLRDITPYTKLYRPNLIEQLTLPELRLFCYIMEKMNQWNVVDLNPTDPELYEYTGYACREQMYKALQGLRDMSIVLGPVKKMNRRWIVSEDCMVRHENGKNDQDGRPYVKMYSPRVLIGMTAKALSLFSYICVKMDHEGCIKTSLRDYRALTGFGKARSTGKPGQYKRTAVQLYLAKKELKELDVIRDITTLVDDGESEELRKSVWFRVNPNIFIKGNRLDTYGVE